MSILLISKSTLLVELIRYISITSIEEIIYNYLNESKLSLINKDIIRRIV